MSMTAPIRRPHLTQGTLAVKPGTVTPGPLSPPSPSRHLRPVAPAEPRRGRGIRRAPGARRRPKAFFAYLTAGVMFGVMVAQMLLSVALESGAYEIAHLQTANKEATRTFDKVSQDIDRLASPQHLARNAEALGMLSNNTPAYLRLSDGALLGAPSSGEGFANLVAGDAAGLVPNSLLADVPIVTAAPATGSAGSPAAAGQVGASTPPAPTGPVALSNGLPGLSTH